MADRLRQRLARSQQLYAELAQSLTAGQLGSRLGKLRSNTVGEQLWCVVGARTSYARAARAGSWQGFSSPLTGETVTDPAAVRQTLASTHLEVVAALNDPGLGEDGLDYLWDLLEHEAQHQGQLIRYLYGLGIERPPSWRSRYALD